jgi:5'(3')-deoxyribonucleotidase
VQADVLIDDNLDNVKTFAEGNQQKLALLLSQPWNKKIQPLQKLIDAERIIVAKDWAEIRTLLK